MCCHTNLTFSFLFSFCPLQLRVCCYWKPIHYYLEQPVAVSVYSAAIWRWLLVHGAAARIWRLRKLSCRRRISMLQATCQYRRIQITFLLLQVITSLLRLTSPLQPSIHRNKLHYRYRNRNRLHRRLHRQCSHLHNRLHQWHRPHRAQPNRHNKQRLSHQMDKIITGHHRPQPVVNHNSNRLHNSRPIRWSRCRPNPNRPKSHLKHLTETLEVSSNKSNVWFVETRAAVNTMDSLLARVAKVSSKEVWDGTYRTHAGRIGLVLLTNTTEISASTVVLRSASRWAWDEKVRLTNIIKYLIKTLFNKNLLFFETLAIVKIKGKAHLS